jgi:ATP-dependent DNA helicase RecG
MFFVRKCQERSAVRGTPEVVFYGQHPRFQLSSRAEHDECFILTDCSQGQTLFLAASLVKMTTTPEQINLWRSSTSEHQRLEFKEAKTQFDFGKLCKYCVALANEGGGHMLLGIADKPPRQVVGTIAVNDPVGMAEKLFQHVGFRVDVEAVNHPDGRVVVFNIPSRPRGTAYHLDGAYLMRAGEELVPMSEDQLRRIFAEGKPDWLEEYERTGLDPTQVIDLLDTQGFFELLKIPYPTEQGGVIERLTAERLVDHQDGSYAIRRLGALLLAKRLQDFPNISRKAPRVVVYTGASKLDTKLDQSGIRGYAVGFQGLVRFVMGQLPQNEIIKDALRTEVKLVPEIVIRELVANALIHQDFNISGASLMIEVYSDRIEISNPGEPIVPVERFIDGYQSRNERMADLMRRMRICEEKSSGIDKVIHAAEAYQLPAPDFRKIHQRTVVVIYGPRDFEDMDRNDRIRACYQHCALKWVMSERMTNQSLRDRFHLPESKSVNVSQIIAAALEGGLIKPDEKVGGSRKFARYLPFWA